VELPTNEEPMTERRRTQSQAALPVGETDMQKEREKEKEKEEGDKKGTKEEIAD